MKETTVVIIGGGATGTGILRDLAMRGVRALLFEMGTNQLASCYCSIGGFFPISGIYSN